MNGYLGRILLVDLTTGTILDEPLNEAYARAYVGGSALAARYIADQIGPDTDPLGPENPLVFMTGPLVGTTFPSSSRFSVCGLSPLTGIWGEANSGGYFGGELRAAGYDGIILRGISTEPVWLSIIEGKAALHPADDLWGLDSYETQTRLRELMGEPKARVACIGLAGENRVKMAGIMNDHGRTAARTGLGAVMGSKRLKAIGVRGSAKPPLADPEGYKQVVKKVLASQAEDMSGQALRLAGTAGYLNMAMMYGDLPVGYYQQGEWEEADRLSGITMATTYQNRNTGCHRCTIACGRETRAPAYQADKIDGPEYETVAALGALNQVSDLEAVIYAGHLCNLYGIDTISLGATIALATELFERGLLKSADTGGIELRYGDEKLLLQLIDLTVRREGIGDLLAEGSAALADRFGVPELAVTVKRLEVPMHDPRAFVGMAVTYALSPRGACHMQGDLFSVDTGQGLAPELGILPGDRFDSSFEKGQTAARDMAWRGLYNALTICQFQNPGVEPLQEAINTVTGWSLSMGDLLVLGKRGLDIKRRINLKLGLSQADDRLPELLTRSLAVGGTEGNVPNMETLLAGAYAELGWDPYTGIPLSEEQ